MKKKKTIDLDKDIIRVVLPKFKKSKKKSLLKWKDLKCVWIYGENIKTRLYKKKGNKLIEEK